MATKENSQAKILDSVIEEVSRKHGKGSIMLLGDKSHAVVDVISTGSIILDKALGIGGIPKGRIIEIYGPESSGKTTVALQIVANAQKNGGSAAFIDAEHALDPEYAKALGVDTDSLLVSQPDSGEQALAIAEILIQSGTLDVVVIDSVAALVPQAELNASIGDAHVGLQARLMAQAMRRLTGIISTTGTAAVFINQIREKIGGSMPGYGGPNETTTGGRALRFHASVRIEVKRIGSVKEQNIEIANRTKVKIAKNKLAAPFRLAFFDITYGKGVIKEGEIVDIAEAAGLIKRAGSWFSYNGTQLGQGKPSVIRFLQDPDNADILSELDTKIATAEIICSAEKMKVEFPDSSTEQEKDKTS